MMTDDEMEALAERVASKITQGILRMPDDLREALKELNITYISAPGLLMPGPNAYYCQIESKPSGIDLLIKRPDGSNAWRAVIV